MRILRHDAVALMVGLFLVFFARPVAADDPPEVVQEVAAFKRIPWNDSKLEGSPEPPSPYKTVKAYPGVTLDRPLTLTPEPGTDRLFVLEHLAYWAGPGRLVAFKDDQGATEKQTLLDIDGLAVGLAFHPNYRENGYLYIGLNGPMRGPKTTHVLRFTMDHTTGTIDPNSKLLIIGWPSNGHDGGDVAFGNDGYLYISSGDGSSDSDGNNSGQRIDDLPASMLRIDVDHSEGGKNYSVPADNPFVGRAGARPEVWAYGLRNPWRISHDKESDQLWVGNNGQDLWEQTYLIRKGANYGWSLVEGTHIFQTSRQAGPEPISKPITEHPHSEARSLTGGRVYRGPTLPELKGAYVYGDWSTGRVWAVSHDGENLVWHKELVDTPFNITGFGTDHANELYVIDEVSGLHRLEPNDVSAVPSKPFPTRLSQTGLYRSVSDNGPHEAAVAFDVVAPQWADGASMSRFVILPGQEKILKQPQQNAGGSWTLPDGSVLVQTLSLPRPGGKEGKTEKRIETRLLVKQQKEWAGYSYRWNDEQTDAELVPAGGASEEIEVAEQGGGVREQVWRFPARTECLTCHSRAAGYLLGFSPLQLDRDFPAGHGAGGNQLQTLEASGFFEDEAREGGNPRRRRRGGDAALKLVNPYEATAPVEDRARSYLHVNCSVCHVEAGGGNSKINLSRFVSLPETGLVDKEPIHDHFNLPSAKLIAPGAPDQSVLMQRLSRRGTGQMPPLVTTEVDQAAVSLISQWIKEMARPEQ